MRIGLLGYGVVGKGVCQIIDEMNQAGDWMLEIEKIFVRPEREKIDPRMTDDINDILYNSKIDFVVECMGGIHPAYDYCMDALNAGKEVVTSNKAMMATHYKELLYCAREKGRHILFEASVGGGILWMHNIGIAKRVDEILRFQGILNGTTNYILDNMFTCSKDFDEVLKEAQELGYAERDPSSDIDGEDVRYKCCLSANAIWNTSVDLQGIDTLGIRYITKKDIEFCKANKMVCRLIGTGEKTGKGYSIYVQPEFLSENDLMAHVSSNYNCGSIYGETCGHSYFMGQGAGMLPTANAVVQDLMSLVSKCQSRLLSNNVKTETPEDGKVCNDSVEKKYYVRGNNVPQELKEYAEKVIDDTTVITKTITVTKMMELYGNLTDKKVFVAGVSAYD
ncbi:MAG: homoserine dehydrogenase [Lachnospiraceae bacterium]|nr:homoserine dehydrogenase [Lachnospiraceae bacterium]